MGRNNLRSDVDDLINGRWRILGAVLERRAGLIDVATIDDKVPVVYGLVRHGSQFHLDGLVLLTEWNEFRALNLVRVGELLKQKLIVDLRNVYAPDQMLGYGFTYVSIGRAPALAKPALAVAAE